MWWHRTLIAYFRETGGGGFVPPGERTEVTKIEAEHYTDRVGNFETNSNSDGVICIGYIENGHRAYYTLTTRQAGLATLQFIVATGMTNSTFTVWVNGAEIGRITISNTGDWNTYQLVQLASDANLVAGANTIQLRFETPINVDYLRILTGPGTMYEVPLSVRPGESSAGANKTPRTNVILRPGVKGFSAVLPANHKYTSYRLINLQGREISKGKVGDGETTLRFDNVRSSVLFLRLEGRGVSTVVRAVTY